MAVSARVKFSGAMPFEMEHKLVKAGFRVSSRAGREWMILERVKVKVTKVPEIIAGAELDEGVKSDLLSRCNTVVNCFHEPELHLKSIRIRLKNIAMTLPIDQRKFVHDWMDLNCVEDQ